MVSTPIKWANGRSTPSKPVPEVLNRESLPSVFSNPQERQQQNTETLQAELYRQIGQLKVELEWVKETQDFSGKRIALFPVRLGSYLGGSETVSGRTLSPRDKHPTSV